MRRVKKISKHLPHYMPLFGILLAGVLGFMIFSHELLMQLVIISSVAVAYVIWGVMHHRAHNDLTLAIFVEYLIIAGLGLITIASLIGY